MEEIEEDDSEHEQEVTTELAHISVHALNGITNLKTLSIRLC